ncbi:unnamed protein product, partial [Lymnaea stagnalis]
IQVGKTLQKLWGKSWIIGDFCGSDVYVDQENGTYKVYVVSLSHLNLLNTDVLAKENVLEDAQEVFRAAPEVLKHSMFSRASDTYCLGHLIWETLTAFDNPKMKKDDFKEKLQFDGFKSLSQIKDEIRRNNENEEKEKLEVPDYNQWVQKYYNEKVQEKLEERLTKPKCCSEDFYLFIKECLHVKDCNRPTKSLV